MTFDYEKLKTLAQGAGGVTWSWWTSNSTLRLTTEQASRHGADGDALTAYGDNISCPEPYREFIAAANPAVMLALIAEYEVLRKDAERYRWLRDPGGQEDLGSEYNMPPIICGYAEHEDILANHALDQAIDTGMEEMKR